MPARLNHLAVLAAAIAFFLLGYLWYGLIFTGLWTSLVGPIPMNSSPMVFVGSFLCGWVMAYFVAIALTNHEHPQAVRHGVEFGIFMGIGIYATMLLSLADSRRTFVLNHPAGLREANEKLYSLNFPDAIPPTLVTYEIPRLKAFLDEQGGEMIVKPLDGHGGEGVFLVTTRDRNLGAILETVTQYESRPIMAQRYLPEARNGDKRLIVLDGEPLGCTLRVPREDEHRGNIHVGGTCVKAPVTARDREICRMLKPRLKRDGLYFVGLDIIGDYLTEVNVTSPTGVQEIDRLDGVKLEGKVIDFVESRVAALKR